MGVRESNFWTCLVEKVLENPYECKQSILMFFTPAPRSAVTKVTVSEMAGLASSIQGKQRLSRQINTIFYAQILLWML